MEDQVRDGRVNDGTDAELHEELHASHHGISNQLGAVGLVKAANFGADRLTAALVKSAPQMYFERSGIFCHGYDLWYTFSLKDRHGEDYVKDMILPDLDKIVEYLENQI